MKVNTKIDAVNNRWVVEISVTEPTALEAEYLNDYGEPLIEVGGNIAGAATRPDEAETAVDFDLPTEQRRMITDFPLKKFFDLNDDADADVNAKAYADVILTRLSAARTTLLSNNTSFIGETTVTL